MPTETTSLHYHALSRRSPPSPPSSSSIVNIEKQANDPLQVLATQKKVSFDESTMLGNNTNTNTRANIVVDEHSTPNAPLKHSDLMMSYHSNHQSDSHHHRHSPRTTITTTSTPPPSTTNSRPRPQLQQPLVPISQDESSSPAATAATAATVTAPRSSSASSSSSTSSQQAQPLVDEDLILSDAKINHNFSSINNRNSSNNGTNDLSDDESSNTNNNNTNDPNNNNSNGVMNPNDEDILSGRGAGVNLHPGNVFFRKLIQANKAIYLKADPGEKKRIIRRIVEKAMDHGRFLKQDPKNELWTEITCDEARKKTGQALRENGPAIKKQHKEHMKRKYEAQFSNLPTFVALQQSNSNNNSDGCSGSGSSTSNSSSRIKNGKRNNNRTTTTSISPSSSPTNFSSRIKREIPLSSTTTASSATASSAAAAAAAAATTNNVTTSLLWSRMNMLQEKQEQLKRKQRELEDEQNHLMHCFYQLSAAAAVSASTTSTAPSRTSTSCSSSSVGGGSTSLPTVSLSNPSILSHTLHQHHHQQQQRRRHLHPVTMSLEERISNMERERQFQHSMEQLYHAAANSRSNHSALTAATASGNKANDSDCDDSTTDRHYCKKRRIIIH